MRIVSIVVMPIISCMLTGDINAREALSPEMMFALTNGMPAHVKFKGMYDHVNGHGPKVMKIANFPDGDVGLVCNNWVCPTSIVVNGKCYELCTNVWKDIKTEIELACANSVMAKGFSVRIESNERSARRRAFADFGSTSMVLEHYMRNALIMPLDASTNSFYLAYNSGGNVTGGPNFLVYKNMIFSYFRGELNEEGLMPITIMTAILNAGLPENERIDLSKVDQKKLQKCME